MAVSLNRCVDWSNRYQLFGEACYLEHEEVSDAGIIGAAERVNKANDPIRGQSDEVYSGPVVNPLMYGGVIQHSSQGSGFCEE